MLRNPYVAGVERFEVRLASSVHAVESAHRQEQAAFFCLLLWEQFQDDLRAIRYTINFDHMDDSVREFNQSPPFAALIEFDTSEANQIDIECIGQQPARTSRDLLSQARQDEAHFPLLLEVFIPLHPNFPQQSELSLQPPIENHLVIWCRPHLLSVITALWERASTLLLNRTS